MGCSVPSVLLDIVNLRLIKNRAGLCRKVTLPVEGVDPVPNHSSEIPRRGIGVGASSLHRKESRLRTQTLSRTFTWPRKSAAHHVKLMSDNTATRMLATLWESVKGCQRQGLSVEGRYRAGGLLESVRCQLQQPYTARYNNRSPVTPRIELTLSTPAGSGGCGGSSAYWSIEGRTRKNLEALGRLLCQKVLLEHRSCR